MSGCISVGIVNGSRTGHLKCRFGRARARVRGRARGRGRVRARGRVMVRAGVRGRGWVKGRGMGRVPSRVALGLILPPIKCR